MAKRELPRVHFYDQDLVDMYEKSWQWVTDFWKKGTEENGLQSRFFSHPDSDRISQFEACFSVFWLVYCNRIFPVMSLIDNFYAKQEPSGAIRGEYRLKDGKPILSDKNPEGIHPPLFAWAENALYHRLGSKKRVRDVLPILERYHQWLEDSYRCKNGLYSVPLAATMMENAPRRAMAYPVDFNAQQAANALYMSALGDLINDKDVCYRYKRAFFSLKTRINALMWNKQDGFYYDLDKNEQQIPVKTVASLWTLLAEIPNEDRAQRLIGHLTDPKEFGIDNPFPTLAASEEGYDRLGQGYQGSVFPPFNYMIIKGLEKYGRHDLARDSAIRHLYYVLDGLHPEDNSNGSLWEAYAPQHEGPARWRGKKGFPRQLFLPYAGLSTIALMIENVVGLSISLPRKTVEWTIPTLESMGIEALGLKRNVITILSNKSSRGWEIRLESEKLYYLTIDVIGVKKKTLPIPSGKCSLLIDKL